MARILIFRTHTSYIFRDFFFVYTIFVYSISKSAFIASARHERLVTPDVSGHTYPSIVSKNRPRNGVLQSIRIINGPALGWIRSVTDPRYDRCQPWWPLAGISPRFPTALSSSSSSCLVFLVLFCSTSESSGFLCTVSMDLNGIRQ